MFVLEEEFLTRGPVALYRALYIISNLELYFFKLHSQMTADQPTTNADQFLWLGRVWSGKKIPDLIEERIYPRSTPAVSAMYPWCTNAQIPLFPTYPVFPADQSLLCMTNPRPIPDTTTLTTLNIGLIPNLYAWFPLPASNE